MHALPWRHPTLLTREEAERFRDGEVLALVFAQEHGAGLEAWQTRSHREDFVLR